MLLIFSLINYWINFWFIDGQISIKFWQIIILFSYMARSGHTWKFSRDHNKNKINFFYISTVFTLKKGFFDLFMRLRREINLSSADWIIRVTSIIPEQISDKYQRVTRRYIEKNLSRGGPRILSVERREASDGNKGKMNKKIKGWIANSFVRTVASITLKNRVANRP